MIIDKLKQILEENFETLILNMKTWNKNKMGIHKVNKIIEIVNNNDRFIKKKETLLLRY